MKTVFLDLSSPSRMPKRQDTADVAVKLHKSTGESWKILEECHNVQLPKRGENSCSHDANRSPEQPGQGV